MKQGDIIKVSLDPVKGHAQAGYRPALIVSGNEFHKYAKLAIVCPITNTNNSFPLHVPLDSRTKTTGVILCEHVRTLDLNARDFITVEKLPNDILSHVLSIIAAEFR